MLCEAPVSPAGAGCAFETSLWVLRRRPCWVCSITFQGTRGFVQVHGLPPGPSVFGSSLGEQREFRRRGEQLMGPPTPHRSHVLQGLMPANSKSFFFPFHLAPGSLAQTEGSGRALGMVGEARGMCADSLSGRCPLRLEMVRAAAALPRHPDITRRAPAGRRRSVSTVRGVQSKTPQGGPPQHLQSCPRARVRGVRQSLWDTALRAPSLHDGTRGAALGPQ